MADKLMVQVVFDPDTGKVQVTSNSKNVLTVAGMLERAKLVLLTADQHSNIVGVSGGEAQRIAAAARGNGTP